MPNLGPAASGTVQKSPPVEQLTIFESVINLKTAVLPFILMLACVSGCAQVTVNESRPRVLDAQTAHRLYQRNWDLKGLTVEGRDIVMDVDTRISIRFAPDGQVAGFAAVNRLSGTYSVSAEGKLSWGEAGFATTRNTGPPELMEKERAYLRALGKTNAAILAGHALVLQSDDASTVLTFSEAGY
ncbi:MAG: hypothetical protein A2V78_14130 [Betaproteobacteria bacterium RBG_16_64_18]|nr:MAG: hypothetical protein A2V78_14130 [Betaproteobacteria bacterium RBG_16_64_18]